MNERLPEALRAWADLIESGYEVPTAAQYVREAADEFDQTRDLLKCALEYWETKNRRYRTRFPAWVNRAVDMGYALVDWKK